MEITLLNQAAPACPTCGNPMITTILTNDPFGGSYPGWRHVCNLTPCREKADRLYEAEQKELRRIAEALYWMREAMTEAHGRGVPLRPIMQKVRALVTEIEQAKAE